MLSRSITPKLLETLQFHPIVLLLGGRQTGKTTLLQMIMKSQPYHYISFDNLNVLSSAQRDPMTFVQLLPIPVIIDEVQRVPEIFLPLKQLVDEHKKPGMVIMTGSANPLLTATIADSLAGRMALLRLMPLSQGEMLQRNEDIISYLFTDQWRLKQVQPLTRATLLAMLCHGGYPGLPTTDNQAQIDIWFNSYLTTILERDVQDLAQIEGIKELPHLLQLLATRTGGLLNVAELSRSTDITHSTLKRYLTLLEAVFLVYELQPWFNKLGKRLVKSSKIYLSDTGLAAYLMGMTPEKLILNPTLIGSLLENFVVQEIAKQLTWSTTRATQYHLRTVSGTEVDIVLEAASGELVGIEIKASQTINTDDFKGLKALQELCPDKFKRGIVLYGGQDPLPFGPNMFALPIQTLWQH